MKIVYASDCFWPRINGVTVSVDSFKKEMEKLGHEIYLFCPEYPGAKELDGEQRNKTIFRFSSYTLLFTSHSEDRLVYPWKKWKVFKTLDSLKPDLVHIHTEFTMGIIVWKWAKKRKVPMVMSCHTYFEEYINFYFPWLPHKIARNYARNREKRFLNKPSHVITPSNLMKNVLIDYGIEKPIHVIPTGIPSSDFSGVTKEQEKKNSEFFKKYPELKGKKILLFVGRIGREKNPEFLIEVLKKLVPEFPDVMLLFAGDGPFKGELLEIVNKKGLAKNVIMLGYVQRQNMKNIYTLADIFVFASKTETQGLVTIEAMICHTPVVALGVMGTKDVMKGDNGGFMVEDNVDLFTEKVRLLLKDKTLYKKKSDEAYRYSQEWTMEKTGRDMLDLYKLALQK